MTVVQVFLALWPLVMIGVIGTIAFTVYRSSKRVSTPAAALAVQPGQPVAMSWNAHLQPAERLAVWSGFGTLEVGGGLLTFRPDAPDETPWQVPASQVLARKQSMFARGGVGLDLGRAPDGSPLRWTVTVSHERINRFAQNDFKRMREQRTADEFLWVLARNGGRVTQ